MYVCTILSRHTAECSLVYVKARARMWLGSKGQEKYVLATEARNNLVAASQNLKSCQKYLSNISFPYVKPQEVVTLDRAIEHIYTDMQTPDRSAHAMQCYSVTQKRAAALLQWFDNVS